MDLISYHNTLPLDRGILPEIMTTLWAVVVSTRHCTRKWILVLQRTKTEGNPKQGKEAEEQSNRKEHTAVKEDLEVLLSQDMMIGQSRT